MDVYVEGKRIRLDPAQSCGKGGEADIFDIGGGKALKLFKPPNHPDYHGSSQEQKGAHERIEEHQKKLPLFPRNLPPRVVSPEQLVTDKLGTRILGYTMRMVTGAEVLLRYGERGFRAYGIDNTVIAGIFRGLYATVLDVHQAGVVLGDFNDLNVLVVPRQDAYIIDADSFQFGGFYCRVFTTRFVDPILCNPCENSLVLAKPHTPESDWYAFAVMLMHCLLFVDPYGGIYLPKDPSKRIPHDARPLHRITVFRPDVRYPKPAVPYGVLPDDLLHFFHRTFEKDERGEFPILLLERMQWTKCSVCKTEHARSSCPICFNIPRPAIKEVTVVRGKVTATRVLRTEGVILFALYQGGELKWLFHENGAFKRENNTTILQGSLDPGMRYRIHGSSTLFGKHGQLVSLQKNAPPERSVVDSFGALPVFDATHEKKFWLANGELMRDGLLGPEIIGNVLKNQTIFWVSAAFGFGFYRAGNMFTAFVFDSKNRGINDTVAIAPFHGTFVDAHCVFSDSRCWFFTASQEGGKIIHRSSVIRRDGTVEATAVAERGDGSWLSAIRGQCAVGNSLFVPTDDGIMRVEIDHGAIQKSKEFPDTELFVDSATQLFPGQNGLYAVTLHEITLLKIA